MLPCMQSKDYSMHLIACNLRNLWATFTTMELGLKSTTLSHFIPLIKVVLFPNMPFPTILEIGNNHGSFSGL